MAAPASPKLLRDGGFRDHASGTSADAVTPSLTPEG